MTGLGRLEIAAEEAIVVMAIEAVGGSPGGDLNALQVQMHMKRCQKHRGRINFGEVFSLPFSSGEDAEDIEEIYLSFLFSFLNLLVSITKALLSVFIGFFVLLTFFTGLYGAIYTHGFVLFFGLSLLLFYAPPF